MRQIALSQSLLYFLDELEYTEAALAADPFTTDLVEPFTHELESWPAVFKKERESRRAVTRAEAVVAVRNVQLDALTQRFSAELLAEAGGKRDAPVFKRFFKNPVSAFVRQALRKQCERTRDELLPELAKVDKKSRLKPYAAWLEKGFTQALEALDQRGAAMGKRGGASHDVAEWKEGINALRTTTYAELLKVATDKSLDRGWAETFFRTASDVASEDAAAEPTATTAPTAPPNAKPTA